MLADKGYDFDAAAKDLKELGLISSLVAYWL
jgi:hypothetical protein